MTTILRILTALVFCFSLSSLMYSQSVNKDKYRLSIKKAESEIRIDGKLSEKDWTNADKAINFLNKWPSDKGAAAMQSEVKMTYDDDNLYIGVINYDSTNTDYVIQTLKRDKDVFQSDNFFILIDPVNQQTNGFLFAVSPLGVQMEGLIVPFSDDFVNSDWDNRWFSEVSYIDKNWIIEIAIPFKTLRYDGKNTEWGINFLRSDQKNARYYSWAHVPLQFPGVDLGYTGTLVWDNPPKPANSNFSIIPYITGGITKDLEEGTPTEATYNAGLDAKVAITSSLNLDLTVNPDFSQIEVDIQQTNLDRFSLFFPERRTFFLENSDIFDGFGIPPIRPFFSRRIGLDSEGNQVPILFGARLSGNLNDDWRIGLMTMHTQSTDTDPAQNFTVGAFQHTFDKRSSFKGIAISRQAFEGTEMMRDDYTRNLGGEFNYISESGNWGYWMGYHASFKPERFARNGFYNAGMYLNSRNWDVVHAHSGVGENYIADVGFVRRLENYDSSRDTVIRLGFNQIYQDFGYKMFPENQDVINTHRLGIENFMVWNDAWSFNQINTTFSYNIFFTNSSQINSFLAYSNEYLPFPINFTDDGEDLPSGWYEYINGGISFDSNRRKLFSYGLELNYGGFYNGTLTTMTAGVRYRKQPWGSFEVRAERNILEFPEEHGSTEIWLIGPRIEINFNKNIFWTTFMQYNTQADNFNINSRFQWRFKPMSDLYLVYTDNYFVENWGPKNRAIVLKLNYWLTL